MPGIAISGSGNVSSAPPDINHTNPEGSGFRNKALTLGKLLVLGGGVTTLMSLAAVNPTMSAGIATAVAKVASGFSSAGAFIGANLVAFSTSAVLGGAVNIADGLLSVFSAAKKSAKYNEANRSLPADQQRSEEFSKLKNLYASVQRRGALQASLGVVAATVGVLALAGVVSNPIGISVAVGLAGTVFLAAQINKLYMNHSIRKEEVKYEARLLNFRTPVDTLRVGEQNAEGDISSVSEVTSSANPSASNGGDDISAVSGETPSANSPESTGGDVPAVVGTTTPRVSLRESNRANNFDMASTRLVSNLTRPPIMNFLNSSESQRFYVEQDQGGYSTRYQSTSGSNYSSASSDDSEYSV
jgi:hypothetical protein